MSVKESIGNPSGNPDSGKYMEKLFYLAAFCPEYDEMKPHYNCPGFPVKYQALCLNYYLEIKQFHGKPLDYNGRILCYKS